MRRRLLAVWALLLALLATIAVIEWSDHRGAPEEPSGHVNRMLLPAPIEELAAIEIAAAGALHRFERDAGGTWFYHGVHTGTEGSHEHRIDPALAQQIAKAFAGFGRTRIEREFQVSGEEAQFGVKTPNMIILVYARNAAAPTMQYAVGDLAPDALSRYVQPVGRSVVVTIPDYQIENLLALIRTVTASAPPSGQVR